MGKGPRKPRLVASDLENARRLVAKHGQDLRWLDVEGRWYFWSGTRWESDSALRVEWLAKSVIVGIPREADRLPDTREKIRFLRAALAAEAYPRVRSMVALARSEPNIPANVTQFDADPWLLNVQNGTLDLRTGKMHAHRREDFLTKLAPVVYDPSARCPTFERFLNQITNADDDLIEFLMKACGYSLTGITSEQCFFILYGTGANGKSTLLNVLHMVLGDYAMHSRTETFLSKRSEGIGNDLARLRGARFVDAVEADGGAYLAEERIKQVTGGDPVTARFLYHEDFEFKPAFKLWVAVNHKPVIRGTEEAIWRRIRLIPFTFTIPEHERDKGLLEKLRAEAPGILALFVRGCLDWQRKGLGMPPAVKSATSTYRGEMDTVAEFLSEQCDEDRNDPTVRVSVKDLYGAYSGWCVQTGHDQLSPDGFGAALTERGFQRTRTKSERQWGGLRLRAELVHADTVTQ